MTPEAADESGRQKQSLAITAMFLVLMTVGATQHELWRDEAHTWLLAGSMDSAWETAATSFAAGHPPAWPLLLQAMRSLGNDPALMALANGLLASLGVYVVARFSPFSLAQRCLYPLGFYPLYQYGLVSRSYAALVLLLLLYCALRPQLYRHPLRSTLPLIAMPWVHAFGVMIALAVAAVEGARVLVSTVEVEKRTRLTTGLVLVLLSSGTVALVLAGVPRDGMAPTTLQIGSVVQAIGSGFFPGFEQLEGRGLRRVGLLLWAGSWLCLIRRPWPLAQYAGWSSGLAAFFLLIYSGGPWHHGFFFIYFVAAIWLAWDEGPAPSAAASNLLTAILIIHVVVGGYAFGYDLRYPISDGAAAARVVRSKGLLDLPLVGVRELELQDGDRVYRFEIDQLQAMTVYLDSKPIYNPVSRAFEPIWFHYKTPDYFGDWLSREAITDELSAVAHSLGSDLLVVVTRPQTTVAALLPHPADKLRDLPPAAQYGETFSVYRFPRR